MITISMMTRMMTMMTMTIEDDFCVGDGCDDVDDDDDDDDDPHTGI